MSKHWIFAFLAGAGLALSGSTALAQGFGGGGGGGGFGGGGFGGGGGGAGGRTPGASTQSLGSNVNQAQPLPLITSRQIQGVFGARTLSQPFQQRFRGLMGNSQTGRGGAAGQYATSGQYRNTRQSSSSTFNSFSMGAQGQRPQAIQQPMRRSKSGAGNAAPLRAGSVAVGFALPKSTMTRITANLEQRMVRVLEAAAVEVELQGRVAVLRGSVATDHDRAVAEQLALLEPGISFVRNELSTTSPPESESDPPGIPSQELPPAGPPAENLPDPPQLPPDQPASP